jgi:hypothetical protein
MLKEEHKKQLEDLINQAESNGETPDFIQNELIPQFKQKYDIAEPAKTPTFDLMGPVRATVDYAKGIGRNVKELAQEWTKPEENIKNAALGTLHTAGKAAELGGRVLAAPLALPLSIASRAFPAASKAAGEGALKLLESNPTGNTVESLTGKPAWPAINVDEAMAKHPTAARAAGDVLNIAGLPLAGIGGKLASNIEKGVVKSVADAGKVTPEIADKAIQRGISKGIKPTVVGKKTLSRFEGFYDKANEAVKTIAENKNLIKIVDENGEIVSHPRTAGEMAQAVDQAKKLIYKQYHDMAIAAGDAGAQFDVTPVLAKLDEVSGDLKYNPQIRDYAQNLKKEIEEIHGQSPEVVEERIKDLNSSLTGFYEGRVGKAKAQVDASVAQLMREELDNKIVGAVGEGYQGLKNKYGALKAIEKEVNHRAIVNARKANKGLIDLTDIFTGGDLAAGILTMNPLLLARGAAGKAIMESYKIFNNPEKQIDKMFRTVYKLPVNESLGDLKPTGIKPVKPLQENEAPPLGDLLTPEQYRAKKAAELTSRREMLANEQMNEPLPLMEYAPDELLTREALISRNKNTMSEKQYDKWINEFGTPDEIESWNMRYSGDVSKDYLKTLKSEMPEISQFLGKRKMTEADAERIMESVDENELKVLFSSHKIKPDREGRYYADDLIKINNDLMGKKKGGFLGALGNERGAIGVEKYTVLKNDMQGTPVILNGALNQHRYGASAINGELLNTGVLKIGNETFTPSDKMFVFNGEVTKNPTPQLINKIKTDIDNGHGSAIIKYSYEDYKKINPKIEPLPVKAKDVGDFDYLFQDRAPTKYDDVRSSYLDIVKKAENKLGLNASEKEYNAFAKDYLLNEELKNYEFLKSYLHIGENTKINDYNAFNLYKENGGKLGNSILSEIDPQEAIKQRLIREMPAEQKAKINNKDNYKIFNKNQGNTGFKLLAGTSAASLAALTALGAMQGKKK